MMLRNKFTHINFFRSIFGNRISPGQIDQIDRITFMVASSLLGIHRHSAIIPHSFAQSGSPVKERSLPTIRIPNQSDIDRPGFLGNFPGNLVFCKRYILPDLSRKYRRLQSNEPHSVSEKYGHPSIYIRSDRVKEHFLSPSLFLLLRIPSPRSGFENSHVHAPLR